VDLLEQIIPDKKLALTLAKRQLSELVYDAVNLEGINFTLPEIQTLLDGVTVGGHKISDQHIALNQANAWKQLFQSVEKEFFSLSKEFVCELHRVAAHEEALEWGKFRHAGVLISGTSYVPPKPDELSNLWEEIAYNYKNLEIKTLYKKAIGLFLDMARIQFFFDVNKRMGRFIMNGVLLSRGCPAINLPFKKQKTFNELMISFYESGDKEPMVDFMTSCIDPKVITVMSNP
jgi:Fic family protein